MPGLSHLGSASNLASVRSRADDGSFASPLQECKGCLRCTSCIWAPIGWGQPVCQTPHPQQAAEPSHPKTETQSMEAFPTPAPTTGFQELELRVTLSRGCGATTWVQLSENPRRIWGPEEGSLGRAVEGDGAKGPVFCHFVWQHGVDGIPWETHPSRS